MRCVRWNTAPLRPAVLNVTGAETLSVREVANWFGERFGEPCQFRGAEGPTALLSDASACFAADGTAEGVRASS